MSLSNFVYNTARDLHRANPFIAVAVATSYGISKVASTYITRFSLPAPAEAAKFSAAAIVATLLFDQIAKLQDVEENGSFTSKISSGASLLITAASLGLAVNYAFNPEKTILSFAKHIAILLPSLIPALLVRQESADNIQMSMDTVLLSSVKQVLNNCHKTVLAGGAAWLISSKLGFDKSAFTAFTVALSVLYNVTRPVFKTFETAQDGNSKYLGRIIPLTLMAKGTSDYLQLDCPLYKPFMKTTAVAAGIICLMELPGMIFGAIESMKSKAKASKDVSERPLHDAAPAQVRGHQHHHASSRYPSPHVPDKVGSWH